MRKSLLAVAALAAAGATLVVPSPAHAANPPIVLVLPPTSTFQNWYAESVDVPVTASGGINIPPANLTSVSYRLTGATNATGTFPISSGTGSGTLHITNPGLTNITVTAVNSANLTTTATKTVGVDGQVPRVIFEGELGEDQPVFVQGEVAEFHYACTDDFTGVKTCDGPQQGSRVDTSTLGQHQVDVAVADNVGNGALVARGYQVVAAAPQELHFAGAPGVAGTAKVGQRLTASAPAVAGPSGPVQAAVSYAWRRDGVVVPGAVGASYPLTAADAGHTLSVTVTAAASGYKSAEASSQGVAVGLADPSLRASMKGTGKGKVVITVDVSAAGVEVSGPVTVKRGSRVVAQGTVRNGRVVVTLKKQPARKKATYTVVFGGGSGVAPAQVKVSGKVR